MPGCTPSSRRSLIHRILGHEGSRDVLQVRRKIHLLPSSPEAVEPLEQRTLFSFVYESLASLSTLTDPRAVADGYFGPVAVLDDLNHDGVRDILVGNAGSYVSGRSVSYLHGAAVVS